MKSLVLVVAAGLAVAAYAEEEAPILLPSFSTYSERVANQDPGVTFAMPASALRFEPLLDLQARNFGEAQSDVTIRGGIFENTGFRIGGVSLYDPQTGHYFAEIPVSPAMLGSPAVLTGADNALDGFNANVGTVSYEWRQIATRGEATLGFGDHALQRQSFYQGYVSPWKIADRALAADAEFSHSRGDGSVAFGDHRFSRVNSRVQLAGNGTQTDLFLGYQTKFFGWPNLYTPFGVHETENLQTTLVGLNHRVDFARDEFVEVGAFYRRNKDDYEFSRETPGLYNPYQHTTWARAIGVSGRSAFDVFALGYAAQILSDDIASTSLVYGPFKSRSYYKVALVPEKTWALAVGRSLTAKAGASFDDTNRDASALSPIVELTLAGRGNQLSVSYAKTSQVPTYTALKSSPAGGLFRGNPTLGRENAHNFEVAWSSSNGPWTFRSAVFYRHDQNLVDWTYSYASSAARTANAVNIDTVGFEGVATYSLAWLRLVFGYTWLDKTPDYRGEPVDASFYALNFAKHRLTIAVVANLGAGFELRLDNVARIQQDNRLRRIGGDETLLSTVGLYYRPKELANFEVSLAVDNLWNSSFQEIPAVPASRRQLSLQAGYKW
jgi:hypothetical protein